jgi:hypothetical protein
LVSLSLGDCWRNRQKEYASGKLFFSRSYISSSLMYVRTLKPGASQYIANWSDIGWFFVGF